MLLPKNLLIILLLLLIVLTLVFISGYDKPTVEMGTLIYNKGSVDLVQIQNENAERPGTASDKGPKTLVEPDD